ncbi:glycosyl transferase family 1, partial [Myxococcota bacterium]|nr:glycosyl transferase family 1 [Myxococcota bacterium]
MTLRIAHLVSYPIYSGPLPPTLGLAKAQRELGHQVYLAYDTKRGAFNEYEEAAEPWLKDAG